MDQELDTGTFTKRSANGDRWCAVLRFLLKIERPHASSTEDSVVTIAVFSDIACPWCRVGAQQPDVILRVIEQSLAVDEAS
jgi:hypothetical protein